VEFLGMLHMIAEAMPDGLQVSIECRLLRGGPEVTVTATWDLSSPDVAKGR
jgi:hypothetical protein